MKVLLRTTLLIIFVLCLSSTSFSQNTNLLPNGDLEIVKPNFWEKVNEGDGGSVMTWDMTTGHNSSRSVKIEKSSASSNSVGWKSANNARLYWNNAKADRLYNLSFWAKTEGVNTNPGNDDEKIGVLFQFYDGTTLLGEQFVNIDQTSASTDWTEYTEGLYIPAGNDPDGMYITLVMGKNATGTVWFDDVGCGTDPWAMWPFNSNFETPYGWMEWHAGNQGFSNTVQDSVYSGEWSVLLHEWDDNDDEMVFYSEPVPAKPNTWYRISVMAKWDSVNTDDTYLPTNITPERDNNRLGMCFFYHKAPIGEGWDLTGGDQFFYFDQRTEKSDGWVEYSVISKSPEDAAGVSVRARFTSYPVGKVWYDDFKVEELQLGDEILPNGDLEIATPNFWEKMNEGDGGSVMTWDMTTGYNSSRSAKIEKSSASTNPVGWKSVNNARLYWNNARADRLYNLSFWAKTEGVNTNPANDDAKIGVLFQFYDGATLLGEQFVTIDQSSASTDWTEYTEGLYIPAGNDPDGMYMTLIMGKDATGTVWFDNIGCGTDPWAMWPFNGDFETPYGWMEWHASGQGFSNTVQDTVYSGQWSALLHEWDDNDDEMVFYSEPVPAEPNTWYKISVVAKSDSINTGDSYLPSNIVPDRDNDRLGMCFFYHKAPIGEGWDLTGGDQFFYFDQRSSSSDGWVEYSVISKSPEDAAGVSVRARFTSYPVGKVWYDDFSVKKVTMVEVPTSVNDPKNYAKFELPKEYILKQNYPNPFNPTTTIAYSVPKDSKIQMEIYNLMGQKVKTLFNGFNAAGSHKIEWDGTNDAGKPLSSGVYLLILRSGNFVTAKRMTLLK